MVKPKPKFLLHFGSVFVYWLASRNATWDTDNVHSKVLREWHAHGELIISRGLELVVVGFASSLSKTAWKWRTGFALLSKDLVECVVLVLVQVILWETIPELVLVRRHICALALVWALLWVFLRVPTFLRVPLRVLEQARMQVRVWWQVQVRVRWQVQVRVRAKKRGQRMSVEISWVPEGGSTDVKKVQKKEQLLSVVSIPSENPR